MCSDADSARNQSFVVSALSPHDLIMLAEEAESRMPDLKHPHGESHEVLCSFLGVVRQVEAYLLVGLQPADLVWRRGSGQECELCRVRWRVRRVGDVETTL